MDLSDLFRLPPGVTVLVAVMLWPAIWAVVSLVSAFASDINRHMKNRMAHHGISVRPYARRDS
jgi:hypothetical protein